MRLKKLTLALTPTVALLVTSCAVQKQVSQESHIEAQSSISLQTEETTLLRQETLEMIEHMLEKRLHQQLENTVTKDEVTERITETFDTTQPIDSATGTPPLQSRVTERSESREKEGSRTRNEVTTSASTTGVIGTATDLSDVVETSETEANYEKKDTECRDEYEIRNSFVDRLGWVMVVISGAMLIWVVAEIIKEKI